MSFHSKTRISFFTEEMYLREIQQHLNSSSLSLLATNMIKSENVLWPRDNCAAQKPPASDSIPSPAPANSTIFLIAFLNARFLCLCTKNNPVLWEFSRANKMMSFAPGPHYSPDQVNKKILTTSPSSWPKSRYSRRCPSSPDPRSFSKGCDQIVFTASVKVNP